MVVADLATTNEPARVIAYALARQTDVGPIHVRPGAPDMAAYVEPSPAHGRLHITAAWRVPIRAGRGSHQNSRDEGERRETYFHVWTPGFSHSPGTGPRV